MSGEQLLKLVRECANMATDETNPSVWNGLAGALLSQALKNTDSMSILVALEEYRNSRSK